MSESSNSSDWRPGRWWAWKVCVFLLTATALSYLDRQALSVVAPVISKELSLDNAELGLLLSAFFYSYAVMHLFVGWILDRFNIRTTYAVFVALWSLSQAFAGVAQGFASLFAARLCLGAFETAGQTGAARIIARILPAKDRAFANGIMMSGGSLGAIIAPVLVIWLANTIGWRPGFVILGGIGLVWAAAWLLWFRAPKHILRGSVSGAAVLVEEDRWAVILRDPRFWSCIAGALFAIPIIHVSAAWVPTYFVQQWGLPLGAGLGAYLFLIYLGLDAGFLGGGAAVTHLIRRGWLVGQARIAVMVVSTVLMVLVAAVPFAPTVGSAVALVFLLNVGRASWGANFLAFNQDISPGRVGMIAGIMGFCGSLGAAFLVWGIGVLSKSGGFRTPFFILAGLAVLGMAPLLMVRWDKPDAVAVSGRLGSEKVGGSK